MYPSTRVFLSGCCALLSVALVTPLIATAQASKDTTSRAKSHSKYGLDLTTPMPPMPLVAPLFIQTDQIDSNITVVNVATTDVQGQVTLRDNQGAIVGQQSMLFTRHSSTPIAMKSLLVKTGSQAHSGSVTLLQDEHVQGLALVAQLSMTLHAGSQSSYLEEEFGMPGPHGSTTMHGLASQTRNLPVVAVTSTVDAPQTIKASCLGQTTTSTVQVPAFGTALVQACTWKALPDSLLNQTANLLSDPAPQDTDHAVTLQSDSVPGAFYAFGFSVNADLAHPELQPLDFRDPSEQESTSIVYVGIPTGSSPLFPAVVGSPTVSLANYSAQPRAIHIDLASSVSGAPQLTPLSQLTLPANSTTTVQLATQSSNSLLNTVTINADGSPGDVEAHLFSPVGTTHQRFELLAKDMHDRRNGGSHPWSLQNGTHSTLLLYNTSDQAQDFEVRLFDPKSDWLELYKLAPHETKAVSISDIVSKGTADHRHKALPATMLEGQVQWSTPSGGGLGRLLETNAATSLARSFSCGQYYNMCDVEFGPYNFSDVPIYGDGDLYSVSAYLCTQIYPNQCSGGTQTSYTLGGITYWTNNSPSIVSLDNTSNTDAYVSGQGLGSFSISAVVEAGSCMSDPVGGGGQVTNCVDPTGETSNGMGADVDPNKSYIEDFVVTLQGPSGTSWDGQQVQEATGAAGQDTCWYSGSTVTPQTNVTGSAWIVGQSASGYVTVGHNQFGPDDVGPGTGTVQYYQYNERSHGGSLPCGSTVHQEMEIVCSQQIYGYLSNVLSYAINVGGVTDCRAGTCFTILNH